MADETTRNRIHEREAFTGPNLGDNIPRPIDTPEYSRINPGLLVSPREKGFRASCDEACKRIDDVQF